MGIYTIEIDRETEKILTERAATNHMRVEEVVALLLKRFALSPHSMKVDEMKDGYVSSGDINLEWANLK